MKMTNSDRNRKKRKLKFTLMYFRVSFMFGKKSKLKDIYFYVNIFYDVS